MSRKSRGSHRRRAGNPREKRRRVYTAKAKKRSALKGIVGGKR